jgi:hypothetical protein
MPDVLAHWRVTYAPGEWIVLAGPTSLVVVQPLAAEWATLVGTLWEEVLACSSIVALADQLAAFGIADMPSFGAFFWTDDGMRSLVRGAVVVRDAVTGETVADGQGVQTWSEVGLGAIDKILVETPSPAPEAMELPLVVGAVHASSLILDASVTARVSSSQGAGAVVPPPPTEPPPTDREPAGDVDAGDGPDAAEDPSTEDYPDTEDYPAAALSEMENGDTELMSLPGLAGPQAGAPADPPQPAVSARLIFSNGEAVDLDRPVRIGRAPSLERGGDPTAKLVTVASPNSDISRTHVQVVPASGQVLVTDLHSTNGTVLVRPGAQPVPESLTRGEDVLVPLGSLLDLGDGVSVRVEAPH